MQDTLERALKGLGGFRELASVRTWLFRIATRVCLDRLAVQRRRRMPTEVGPGRPEGPFAPTAHGEWIAPIPDGWVVSPSTSPEEQLVARRGVRLALVTALQKLPPRQRAAFLLAEVLEWPVAEIAEVLDWTVAGVNSALQRARSALRAPPSRAREVEPQLVERYVAAFERFDIQALVALMAEDVTFDMPPIPLWLRGRADVAAFLRGPGSACTGSVLVPVAACGLPAFGQYHDDGRTPWGLVVLEPRGGEICAIHTFLDVQGLFPIFGLPGTSVAESAMSLGHPAGL